MVDGMRLQIGVSDTNLLAVAWVKGDQEEKKKNRRGNQR
jgi:hypothetical protein